MLDEVDFKIINLLQENARYSLKYLAEQVFLSSPATAARIDKLEKLGIIKGYGVTLDKHKLGYNITAFINLAMSPVLKPEFYAFIEKCENVIECNCVTGEFSMLIKVVHDTTMDLDHFIGKLQKFGKTYTQIVFSTPVEQRGVYIKQTDAH